MENFAANNRGFCDEKRWFPLVGACWAPSVEAIGTAFEMGF